MAEAPELPADPLASFPVPAEVVQPDPARSRRPRVGVVLAAGRSERLASVTGGGSKALLRLGGLSLVERAVRSCSPLGWTGFWWWSATTPDRSPRSSVALGVAGSGSCMPTGGQMATARR
jgi:hypothetical protein